MKLKAKYLFYIFLFLGAVYLFFTYRKQSISNQKQSGSWDLPGGVPRYPSPDQGNTKDQRADTPQVTTEDPTGGNVLRTRRKNRYTTDRSLDSVGFYQDN